MWVIYSCINVNLDSVQALLTLGPVVDIGCGPAADQVNGGD